MIVLANDSVQRGTVVTEVLPALAAAGVTYFYPPP